MFDIVIKNGSIIDGTKRPRFEADVGIQGDRIAAIGEIDPAGAASVIDASDQIISPGFIDMHSHGDFTLFTCPTADSLACQGVTTAEEAAAGGISHPRTFGTFVRVLWHYAREERVLFLEEAIHKMSGLPALKLHFSDRGLLKEGFQADLVIFNPETIADRATYSDPFHYLTGVSHVLCNGKEVISEGRHAGARPGRIIEPG